MLTTTYQKVERKGNKEKGNKVRKERRRKKVYLKSEWKINAEKKLAKWKRNKRGEQSKGNRK